MRSDVGLTLRQDSGGATITLSRPEKHNALDEDSLLTLRQMLRDLEQHAAPQIIAITAVGPSFSAGADIGSLKRISDPSERRTLFAPIGETIGGLVADIAQILRSPRLISIAGVNGAAIGGGWLLAMACDYCLASPRAQFWFPEAGLGRTVSAIAARTVLARFGHVLACEILMLGRRFDASELLRLGCINAVVDAERLADAVVSLREKLRTVDPNVLSAIKSRLEVNGQ